MDKNIALLFGLLIFGYLYFYLSSRQFLRREYFEVGGADLSRAFTGGTPNGNMEVSWPGGVVSPPAFDLVAARKRYGM